MFWLKVIINVANNLILIGAYFKLKMKNNDSQFNSHPVINSSDKIS